MTWLIPNSPIPPSTRWPLYLPAPLSALWMCQVLSQPQTFILAGLSCLKNFECDWFISDVTSSETLPVLHLKLAITFLKGTLSYYLVLFSSQHSLLSEIILPAFVHSLASLKYCKLNLSFVPFHILCVEKLVAHSKSPVNICWINEYNESIANLIFTRSYTISSPDALIWL